MSFISSRSSVLAVVPESPSAEGTPVAPSASTDYIALQNDAAMSPSFDELTSDELKSSIGISKPVLGFENPTFSFTHYFNHSGTEGQAPEFSELMEAGLGQEEVESTEYDTVAGSTTAVVNVDTGEGAEFRIGQPLLVKNSAGYEIRPVHSISTDALTLGFELANAPASGVDLGKAVIWYPLNSGANQSLSVWHYLGNEGALQLMSGSKVTEIALEMPAGEQITANFSLEGIKYHFNPIVIASTDTYIDWTDDDGTFAASVTAKTYRDPHELASALETAMNATATTETLSVSYSDVTGTFSVASSTSTILSLLWNTGANAANTIGDALGFSVAADDTGSTSYDADSAMDWSAPQTPSYDGSDALVAKDNRVFIGDADDNTCFKSSNVSVTISNTKSNVDSICAESGRDGSIINQREVTISVTGWMEKYDVDKFRRFRSNADTRFCYIGGSKTGGNWDAGKCFSVYCPNTTISSFDPTESDGLYAIDLELKAFVDADSTDEIVVGMV